MIPACGITHNLQETAGKSPFSAVSMAKPVCRSEQPSRATHNPAKAVQYACHLLKGCGVAQLTPELLRQAKYDVAMVR